MVKTVCGIDLSGAEAIIVILNGTKASHNQIRNSFKKIELKDRKSQEEVRSFRQTIANHLNNEGVAIVGIKSRSVKGDFSGGPLSFKLEGILQTLELPVQIISPQTIAATLRKNQIDIEAKVQHKYQIDAYKVAFQLLENE